MPRRVANRYSKYTVTWCNGEEKSAAFSKDTEIGHELDRDIIVAQNGAMTRLLRLETHHCSTTK